MQATHPATAGNAKEGLRICRADTFLSRLGGLLVMAPLQAGEGLLLSPCASVHTAFMRYAIDVVFLDRAGVIMKIVPALKPWRMAACAGASQTLELAAGAAARLKFAPGGSIESMAKESTR
jgi:uncharacterized protein